LLLHRALRPLVPLTLLSQRPKAYADQPKTLGEHLLKRRLELGLTQVQVSFQLRTDEFTVGNWEKDRTRPAIRFWPAILSFLKYDPFPEPQTLGDRIGAKRRELGLSIARSAELLGIDEGTLTKWEKNLSRPRKGESALAKLFAL